MIYYKLNLDKSFQEILYRNEKWIIEESGWIIESVISQYISILTSSPLSQHSYIKLPSELRNPKKTTNQHQKQRLKMFSLVSYKTFKPIIKI